MKDDTGPSGRLTGKVAIVAGGGTRSDTEELGIGRATALLFARAGARVVVADVSAENAERTCRDIIAEGGEATMVAADVSDAAACQAMVAAAVERFGALHVLFNNAAVVGKGTVVTFEDENFDRNVAVNLKGPALATRYAIPAMERSGGGSIIYVSSIDGIAAPYSQTVPYSLTKGALHMLTKTTASNHGRQGIRANCIAPGHVHGAFPTRLMRPGARELRRNASPLGTEGTPWDVAWLAVFLASHESRWISGVTIPVDGGLLAVAPLRAYSYLTDTTV
ncbi:MAG: SDR family oxidoreductase [Spirochaetaceae bacterium]|nr:SDR family oxidoreductase [Spirochaetaceae bacterium]